MTERATQMITLQEAAERLGVHYMTAYRYVRHGRLAATRVGGRWMVAPEDVDEMIRPEEASRPLPAADWSGRLGTRLVAGDEAGAWGVVEAAQASGVEPSEILTDVLVPALRSIGDGWQANELTVADEHLASAIAMRIIGRLGPRFARKGRSRGRIVVATPPGELHGIPGAILSDLLRGAGFDVIDLGPNLPVADLANIVAKIDRLVAVCIGATTPGADNKLRRAVRAVKAATDMPVFLGGAAVEDGVHAGRLGGDGWAPDAASGVELISARVG